MLPYDTLLDRARERLDPGVFSFFAAGSFDGDGPARDAAAWDEVRLRPRLLRDVSSVATATTVLGTEISAPVLVAPVAAQGLLTPDGEAATARGTSEGGSLLVLSMRASVGLATVATAAGPWWMQVYVARDRALSDEMAAVAAAHGARALVVTVDTPYVGRKSHSLTTPDSALWAGLLPSLAAAAPERLAQAPDLSAADLARLAERTGLPVVAKGVLRGDEARRCVDAGAAAVVVSSHGGRQLPGTVAPAQALAEVAAAVGDTAEVYVDGGVRRGVDVLRALALGARAVLVGRPVCWALATDGAAGVTELLRGLREELGEVLALAGCAAVSDVGGDLVWHRPDPPPTVEATPRRV